MKIPLSQSKIHDKKDFIAKFYLEKADSPNFNALLVDCLTGHYKTTLKDATRMYFVVEGSGDFTIDGHKDSADLYDLFIVNSGQTYEYRGKMKLIEVNVPATDKNNEEII